jgi:hypothetical protein
VPDDRKSPLRVLDCRGNRLSQRDRAEPVERMCETGDRARHCDRAGTRHVRVADYRRPPEKTGGAATERKHILRSAERRYHRIGNYVRAPITGPVNNHVSTAADPVHPRLDDRCDERRGDRRVDGIAVPRQYSRAGFRGARCLGGHHSAGAPGFRPPDPPFAPRRHDPSRPNTAVESHSNATTAHHAWRARTGRLSPPRTARLLDPRRVQSPATTVFAPIAAGTSSGRGTRSGRADLSRNRRCPCALPWSRAVRRSRGPADRARSGCSALPSSGRRTRPRR